MDIIKELIDHCETSTSFLYDEKQAYISKFEKEGVDPTSDDTIEMSKLEGKLKAYTDMLIQLYNLKQRSDKGKDAPELTVEGRAFDKAKVLEMILKTLSQEQAFIQDKINALRIEFDNKIRQQNYDMFESIHDEIPFNCKINWNSVYAPMIDNLVTQHSTLEQLKENARKKYGGKYEKITF